MWSLFLEGITPNPPCESSVYRQTWILVSYGHMHVRLTVHTHWNFWLPIRTSAAGPSLALAEALNQIYLITKYKAWRIWTPQKEQQLTNLSEGSHVPTTRFALSQNIQPWPDTMSPPDVFEPRSIARHVTLECYCPFCATNCTELT